VRLLLAVIAGLALAGGGLAAARVSHEPPASAPSDPALSDPALSDPALVDPAPVHPAPVDPTPVGPARPFEAIRWRRSRTLGLPFAGGRLVNGVKLPAEGELFFTWDPVKKRTPNRWWRRYGADTTLRRTLTVLRRFARAHPDEPRVGIGDISRTHGGDFGRRFGPLGHASHQNGRDVDVYYPRLDRLERAALRPAQVDRRLAQDLVDLFVGVGARKIFVGPSLGLRGPRRVVIPLAHHDNHLHARF
jgi:Penicillin-insensitive murein endopeptidase